MNEHLWLTRKNPGISPVVKNNQEYWGLIHFCFAAVTGRDFSNCRGSELVLLIGMGIGNRD